MTIRLDSNSLLQFHRIVESSVKEIEDAQVILLCEHHFQSDVLVNADIINQLYKDGDIVLVESSKEDVAQEEFIATMFSSKKLRVHGWDSVAKKRVLKALALEEESPLLYSGAAERTLRETFVERNQSLTLRIEEKLRELSSEGKIFVTLGEDHICLSPEAEGEDRAEQQRGVQHVRDYLADKKFIILARNDRPLPDTKEFRSLMRTLEKLEDQWCSSENTALNATGSDELAPIQPSFIPGIPPITLSPFVVDMLVTHEEQPSCFSLSLQKISLFCQRIFCCKAYR